MRQNVYTVLVYLGAGPQGEKVKSSLTAHASRASLSLSAYVLTACLEKIQRDKKEFPPAPALPENS